MATTIPFSSSSASNARKPAAPPTITTGGASSSTASSSSNHSNHSNNSNNGNKNEAKEDTDYTHSGLKMWVDHFGPGRLVPWQGFVDTLHSYLRSNHPKELQGFVALEQVLRFLIDRSEANRSRSVVALEEWVVFLHRFGPVDCCLGKATRSFFTPDGQMVPWFHGNISRHRAKEILLEEARGRPGSFLVRFSETNPKNFTLTYLDEAELLLQRHQEQQKQQQQQQQQQQQGQKGGRPALSSSSSSSTSSSTSSTPPPPGPGQLPSQSHAHSQALQPKYKNVLLFNRGKHGFALEATAPPSDCYPTVRELIDCRQGWSVPCLSALATRFSEEIHRESSLGHTHSHTHTHTSASSSSASSLDSAAAAAAAEALQYRRRKSGSSSNLRGLGRSGSHSQMSSLNGGSAGGGSEDGRGENEGGGGGGIPGLASFTRTNGGGGGVSEDVFVGVNGENGYHHHMLDSPVYSPEGEASSSLDESGGGRRRESGEGGEGGDGEEEEEEEDEVEDGEGDDDNSHATHGSSPGRMLVHERRERRRRRRRRRRRHGSGMGSDGSGSVSGSEEEEEEDDDDDDDEMEDDDDDERHEPSEEEMKRRLRLLHTMSSVSSIDEAAELLNRAMLIVATGKYEEALQMLDDVLGLAGADHATLEEADMQARAAKVKGTVLQEMGLMKEASVWYELCVRAGHRVLQQAPATVELAEYFPPLRYVHSQLAQFYLSVQAYSLVIEHFEELLALTDDPPERRLLLREFERLSLEHDFWQDVTPGMLERELDIGKNWYRDKNLEDAALQFRRVVQLARLSSSGDRLVEARALGNYATVLKELQKSDEAILSYRFCCRILHVLNEQQMERRMLNGLSLCYMEAGRYADAKEVCQRLLALTEREDNLVLVRARIEEIQGKLREEAAEGEEEEGEEGGGEGVVGGDGGVGGDGAGGGGEEVGEVEK